jgi:hypothetical protein
VILFDDAVYELSLVMSAQSNILLMINILIRKPLSFYGEKQCRSMTDPVVINFWKLWENDKMRLGGEFDSNKEWKPSQSDNGQLLVAAFEVLDHFFMNYGGIWTGCFKLERTPACRGALAGLIITLCYRLLSRPYFPKIASCSLP